MRISTNYQADSAKTSFNGLLTGKLPKELK